MQPMAIAYTWYVFGGKGGEDVSTVELDFLKSKMADLQLKGLGGGMGSVICLYAKMLMITASNVQMYTNSMSI